MAKIATHVDPANLQSALRSETFEFLRVALPSRSRGTFRSAPINYFYLRSFPGSYSNYRLGNAMLPVAVKRGGVLAKPRRTNNLLIEVFDNISVSLNNLKTIRKRESEATGKTVIPPN